MTSSRPPTRSGSCTRRPFAPTAATWRPRPRASAHPSRATPPTSASRTCDPSAKPGVTALRDLVLATYPCTTQRGDRPRLQHRRHQRAQGGPGLGLDDPGRPPRGRRAPRLAPRDRRPRQQPRHGPAPGHHVHRLEPQIWRAYKALEGWQPYTGSNPHTDHVHFSFSWAGAKKQTSFWTAPQTCTPKCDGTKIVSADCGVGDCGVYGALCVDDSLGVRCVFSMCPAQGTEQILCERDDAGQLRRRRPGPDRLLGDGQALRGRGRVSQLQDAARGPGARTRLGFGRSRRRHAGCRRRGPAGLLRRGWRRSVRPHRRLRAGSRPGDVRPAVAAGAGCADRPRRTQVRPSSPGCLP